MVEDMGINHRRLPVAMSQEFLNRSNMVPAFEQQFSDARYIHLQVFRRFL